MQEQDTKNIRDKVALVTGGGSGIGQATALAFARRGARVVVAGRREEAGEGTLTKIRCMGGEALFVPTDVSRPADVEALVNTTLENFGRLDFAVNSAGTEGRIAPTAELTSEDYEQAMDVNVKGVFLCMQQEIRAMLKAGSGSIVNVASIYAQRAVAGSLLYVAGKHAVIGMTKAAALDYAGQGLRINAISPGAVETAMLERVAGTVSEGSLAEGMQAFASMVPMGRLGRPEEAARTILWLCSDSASYMTGTSLVMDGGLSA